MASLIDDLKYAYATGNIAVRFIYINVAVYLLLVLVRTFGFFFKNDFLGEVLPWISGSSKPLEMLYKPWTAFTYMFVHEGFLHLLFNMILLYFAGRIFADLLNERRFIAVYILGGLAGFALYFTAFNIFPVFEGADSIIYGASASIMAVLVAIAAYAPNMELRLLLIGNVKLKYIAIVFVAMDVLFLDGENSGGKLAHIGGALLGYFFSFSLKRGNDWSRPFFACIDFVSGIFTRRPKLKVASNQGYKSQYYSQTSREDKAYQQKIDRILDKISRSGYDSLSKEEKEFLFHASKK